MEPITMEIDGGSQFQVSADPLPFARSYQLEALEKAIHENTIVFLETGSGKTLIAIMLLRSYAYMLRKPSRHIAVFLVPKVVLVTQQAKAVKMHTDLKVGMYWGDMGVDYWDAAAWEKEIDEYEVLVMTPAILLRSLRHSFLKLDMIKLLIMDECHHAKGRDPYACIMKEFYHEELKSGISNLPRIFGMTASPIKSKVGKSQYTMSENIRDLMTLMHSKVYTCVSEDVIAKYVPISTPKFKFYRENEIPYVVFEKLAAELNMLKQQYEHSLKTSDFTTSVSVSAHKRISKIFSDVIFCLDGLGVWLALKAAEEYSNERESFSRCKSGDIIIRKFSLDIIKLFKTYLSSVPQKFVGDNTKSNLKMGLLTSKVCCLVETLLEYRALSDMRCIVFVERVVTGIVLKDLLNALLPKYNSWKTKCIAGNIPGLHNQSRKMQNEIVEEFRMGMVNIIVATSILEEGLDVQSCNLVIRFDPCPTVCSFIQSRGRARMQNSDYILMVQSGDSVTHSRLEKYLSSGDIMRKESLRHSSFPCDHFESDQFNEEVYRVESTKAIVTMSSSIELIHIFCSWLPSDGYFKPTPRWVKETGTLHLPKSCPLQTVCVEGDKKNLKKIACLEACKKLHEIGALTDNLVPKIYVEEAEMQDFGNEPFNEEQPSYVPCELVNHFSNTEKTVYHCYLMELNQNFSDDISNIVLAMRIELDPEIGSKEFEMCFDKGSLSVKLRYMGTIDLLPNLVLLCKRFQVSILRLLLDHNMDKLRTVLDNLCSEGDPEIDYLLLPTRNQGLVDWSSINSVNPSKFACENHSPIVWTNNGRVCTCILQNSLVFTPHNGRFYVTTDIMDMNGNSHLSLRDGGITTYKKYFLQKHGIKLKFEQQRLLNARHLYKVKNYCHGHKQQKDTEASKSTVELPPELCCVVMSPMPISIIHSFSFIPSIMHRVESLLVASNLKKIHLDHCTQNVVSTAKVLEAITSKSCGESFHYESLETLGDSFLKYATSQHLFQTYPNHHEGLLTVRREKIISNAALCKFGCGCKLPGFIRNARFDPQTWAVPGYKSVSLELEELDSKGAKAFISGKRKLRRKIIADVVEALIGAYLSTGGEMAALLFMNWIGIKVSSNFSPYERLCGIHPEKLINVNFLESLLNYTFRDRHLLVEALTHGSYMLPEIPRCYQRLEFLGDSVLDYLITRHLDNKYPGMSPGQLTDMRAASVNNDCYAWSAIKAELHKYILHASQDLHKDIVGIVHEVAKFSSASPIGWESDTSFPKVLGDIIESLAGAILVDSEYNKETVWQCIRPLLEPLVTPETLTVHPTRELTELCQKESYTIKKTMSRSNGVTSYLMEVQADDGTTIDRDEYSGYADKKTAKRIVCRKILKRLKSFQKTQPK